MMLKILLITPFIMISPATAQQKPPERHYQGPSLLSIDKDLWARALRDYGMWREKHDRDTFPTDIPKIGEPYDPVTGNAIRDSK